MFHSRQRPAQSRKRHASAHRDNARLGNSPNRQGANRDRGLRCHDLCGLVVYSNEAHILSPLVSALDPRFATAVANLDKLIGGATNMAAGLKAANDLLERSPRGIKRRVWLLADGEANIDAHLINREVKRAYGLWANIDTIGAGNPGEFDRDTLQAISRGTYRGRYFEATEASRLNSVFKTSVPKRRPGRMPRGEACVFVVDGSSSMACSMGGRRRIDIVQNALLGLVKAKQTLWS